MATGKTLARLNVVLDAVTDKFEQGIDRAKSKSDKFRKAAKIGAAGVAAIGGAMVTAAVKAGNMADELLDLSEQTGLSTDQLQEWRRVSNQAGVATDTVAQATQRFQSQLQSGTEQSKQMTDALSAIGVSANDASGGLRPMDQLMPEIIGKLSNMEDTTKRNVAAFDIFGRGASDLLPILGLGADEIGRLRDEAHSMGLVISRESLEGANQFRQQWDSAQQVIGVLVSRIGIKLAPAMTFMLDSIVGFGNNVKTIWIGLQGIILHAVTGIVNTLGKLGEAIPFIGERIGVAREEFNRWANESMVNLRDRMADVQGSTSSLTATLDDHTAAAGRNAKATEGMADAHQQAAQRVAEANVQIQEALSGTQVSSGLTREQLIGDADAVENQGGGAFGRTADAISASAYKVLGAVQRVLQKLSGGGGFLGGIAGAIGGFISGGPLGAAMGFAGGFAEGGTIPAGQFGLVGERGPEFISGPAEISPSMSLSIDTSALPPPPPRATPDALAVDAWWREAFSHLVADGQQRGVLD